MTLLYAHYDQGFLVYPTAGGTTAAVCLTCKNFETKRENHIHGDSPDPNALLVLEEFHEHRPICQRCGNDIPLAYPGLTRHRRGSPALQGGEESASGRYNGGSGAASTARSRPEPLGGSDDDTVQDVPQRYST